MDKPGRNDSCPCGSGKKYKHCHGSGKAIPEGMTLMESTGAPNAATEVIKGLERAMAGHSFANEAELDTFLEQFAMRQRSTPVEDFLGLSPSEMSQVLDASSAAEAMDGILGLEGGLGDDDVGAIPLLAQCLALLGYLAESGPVKATAKGNLPRALVLRWWDETFGPLYKDERTRSLLRPNNEEGDWGLWSARRIIRAAGLVKLRDGSYSLTETGQALLEARSFDRLYALLFGSAGWTCDWNEGRDDIRAFHPLAQRSFVFNLRLIGKFATSWIEGEAIVDPYLKAFPSIKDEFGPAEAEGLSSFGRITLEHGLVSFPVELGLLERKGSFYEGLGTRAKYRISPLYGRLLRWRIPI